MVSRRNLLFAAAGTSLACSGCVSTNKATGRSSFTGLYSPEDDVRLGGEEHPKLLEAFGGEYENRKVQAMVERVGRSLASHTEYQSFPYRFTVLNSPIVNALALPGGYVYVTRGLLALASNEAEVAGVVAHELGHVNARHTAERLSATQAAQFGMILGAIGAKLAGIPSQAVQLGQQIAVLSIQSYSRQQEFESDTLGVRYMTASGYDPDAVVSFLATLREQSQLEARSMGRPPSQVDEYNMMATHPRTLDRVRAAQAAAETRRPANAILGKESYLRALDGMVYGDDPENGVVVGNRFVHPGLRFEFEMPRGFRIRNQPDKVIASDAAGASIVFDIAPVNRARNLPEYVQREWAGRELNDLEPLSINGLSAATGWLEGRTDRGLVDVRLIALKRDDRSAYRLLMVTPRDRTDALAEPFRRATYSFRALSEAEARNVRPLRIQVRPARRGDTIASLARTLPYGALNEAWYRLLNDLRDGQGLVPGMPIKVIEA